MYFMYNWMLNLILCAIRVNLCNFLLEKGGLLIDELAHKIYSEIISNTLVVVTLDCKGVILL